MIVFNDDFLMKEIAYIVENDLLLHAVNKQLANKENVNVIYNSKVENIKLPKTPEENAEIQLQNGTKYKTKLLVSEKYNTILISQAVCIILSYYIP